MKLEDSFKNPFADYNAVVMSSKEILEYWCSPFQYGQFAEITEANVLNEKTNIIFMGGRGTGKTMFLKYFSYPVQIEQNRKQKNFSLKKFLENKGGIGFYTRIDGATLRGFNGYGLEESKWQAIFTHYFELQIGKNYIEMIDYCIKKELVNEKNLNKDFFISISNIIDYSITSFIDLLNWFEDQIKDVNHFREKIALDEIKFVPSKLFLAKSLSFHMPIAIKKYINEIPDDLNFVLMVDEYENFLPFHQRIINTLLKFIESGISFRLGMRLEGFNTFDTVSQNEFIKEGRDYRKIVFDEAINKDAGYQEFLWSISEKRLSSIKMFKQRKIIDIKKILGTSENLEQEARYIIKDRSNKTQHFNILSKATQSSKEIINKLKNDENPLQDILNIIWVNRGKSIQETSQAMIDFNSRRKYYSTIKQKEIKEKYKLDYTDKYKLSLMILLASIYRINKKYYSFNTFCFLSSGIVGNFIELCRKSFDYANFEAREKLYEGIITPDTQDKASRDVAITELNMIRRIPEHGDLLYHLINNLGNIFKAYHLDTNLTYPETNQFSADISSMTNSKYREAFTSALRWSLIQRKTKLQNVTSGNTKKEVFILNHIFSPLYNISYRTRGGYSAEDYSSSELKNLMEVDEVLPKTTFAKRQKYIDSSQQELKFDLEL